MDRPNLTTSTKSVQRYIESLEQQIADQQAHIATLTREVTNDDDEGVNPHVAFVREGITEFIPLARQKEDIWFIPEAKDRMRRFQVAWDDHEDALSIHLPSLSGAALAIYPQGTNRVDIRAVPQ